MHIRYGYVIDVLCEQPTTLITMLDVHPERRRDLTQADDMVVTPLAGGGAVETGFYQDQFANLCRRFVAPAGGVRLEAEGVIHDSGFADPMHPLAEEVPPDRLPDETLVYLLGSRYCETDQLTAEAWRLFGALQPGWGRVQAINDFVHDHISFGYQHARNTRTAAEAYRERIGVCRDFAHLAVAFCRCLNIPARYATGYLGDIGVPRDPAPMDFSAWYEVYLGGQWHTFDARHNQRRIGRIVIAYGRDATDVPIVHSFGAHTLGRFEVITEEVHGARFPVTSEDRRDHWSIRTGIGKPPSAA